MILEIDHTYSLRNGKSAYIFEKHFNESIDVMMGWGSDRICHWFERTTGRNYNIMGYSGQAQRMNFNGFDVIGEELLGDDLRADWTRRQREGEERKARRDTECVAQNAA